MAVHEFQTIILHMGKSDFTGPVLDLDGSDAVARPPLYVDVRSEEISQELEKRSRIFRKKGKVEARRAEGGEAVETVLEDGTVETANTAKPGDYIVTNPGGERYIVERETFEKRYEPTGVQGQYQASGFVRAIMNPRGRPITITAPWGEKQVGNANCLIVAAHDPSDPDTVSDDRYIIAGKEFLDTYEPATQ